MGTERLNAPYVVETASQRDVTIDTAADIYDGAIAGFKEWSLAAGNISIPTADFQQNAFHRFTGAVGATDVTLPLVERPALFDNASGQAVTLKRGVTSVVLASGEKALMALDGTTNGLTKMLSSAGAATFIELDDVPASYSGQAGLFLKVNPGETALIFGSAPDGNASDVIEDATTARALSAGDAGKWIRFTSGSAISVTVPDSVMSKNDEVVLEAAGDGTITVTASGTATVNSRGSLNQSAGKYAVLGLKCVSDSDDFNLTGDLA